LPIQLIGVFAEIKERQRDYLVSIKGQRPLLGIVGMAHIDNNIAGFGAGYIFNWLH